MPLITEILAEASSLVEPDERERRLVSETAKRLLSVCRDEFQQLEGVVDISVEGSVAKDTWVKGKAEVDIFIHFKPEVGRQGLEAAVLSAGGRVIERLSGRHWLRYASHPYVEGEVSGIRVNIVGCFKAEPGRWISAVDRTPYHTAFVNSRLTPELRRDIRLFKGFLIGCGLYGAEIRVEGFSGYLSELLVLSHGGFLETVRRASSWRMPVFIDMAGRLRLEEALKLFPKAPLIFNDPVDPSRNVAAAVSESKLAEFILACKIFNSSPSLSFFQPPKPWGKELAADVGSRNLLGIAFTVERRQPPDILWGEIKHTLRGFARRLEKEGFQVYRCDAWQLSDEVVLLYELSSLSLPENVLKVGPPVWMDNSLEFIEKTMSRPNRVAGPWVEGERLYSIVRRDESSAEQLLRSWIKRREVAISKELLNSVERGEILTSRTGLVERLSRDKGHEALLREFLEGIATPIRHWIKRC
ncbi:MAG: CCA tRNA nucleotidyltransferase [Nitrososphaerota archaeon]